jgi:HK97 family phage prohead protease
MGDRITDNLFRSVYLPGAVALEQRADDDQGDHLATLDILFARFNSWNEIDSYWEGRFLERVAPGAFTKTMRERAGHIVSLFNHGHDPQIGDKVLGGIVDMGEREAGPFLTVELDNTSYGRDLLPGLRRGAYGASYMFRVINEEWVDPEERTDHNPSKLPERTIREVKLYEAGPVTFPADESTVVGVRSSTDRFWSLRNLRAATALGAPEPTPPADEPVIHSTVSLTPARARHDVVAWAS